MNRISLINQQITKASFLKSLILDTCVIIQYECCEEETIIDIQFEKSQNWPQCNGTQEQVSPEQIQPQKSQKKKGIFTKILGSLKGKKRKSSKIENSLR